MSLTPGVRIGVYEILGHLGAGGMGEVYRARDARLNRDVAIKVLPAAVAADPDRLARLEREAQTLAALNHPNIAQIHGVLDLPRPVAASRDGSMFAFTGNADGAARIYLRARDEAEAHLFAGGEPGSNPALSPDGRMIACISRSSTLPAARRSWCARSLMAAATPRCCGR